MPPGKEKAGAAAAAGSAAAANGDGAAAPPSTTAVSSGRPAIEGVIVHPLVLLSVTDHYNRVAKDTRKRVVGVLLGETYQGRGAGRVACMQRTHARNVRRRY